MHRLEAPTTPPLLKQSDEEAARALVEQFKSTNMNNGPERKEEQPTTGAPKGDGAQGPIGNLEEDSGEEDAIRWMKAPPPKSKGPEATSVDITAAKKKKAAEEKEKEKKKSMTQLRRERTLHKNQAIKAKAERDDAEEKAAEFEAEIQRLKLELAQRQQDGHREAELKQSEDTSKAESAALAREARQTMDDHMAALDAQMSEYKDEQVLTLEELDREAMQQMAAGITTTNQVNNAETMDQQVVLELKRFRETMKTLQAENDMLKHREKRKERRAQREKEAKDLFRVSGLPPVSVESDDEQLNETEHDVWTRDVERIPVEDLLPEERALRLLKMDNPKWESMPRRACKRLLSTYILREKEQTKRIESGTAMNLDHDEMGKKRAKLYGNDEAEVESLVLGHISVAYRHLRNLMVNASPGAMKLSDVRVDMKAPEWGVGTLLITLQYSIRANIRRNFRTKEWAYKAYLEGVTLINQFVLSYGPGAQFDLIYRFGARTLGAETLGSTIQNLKSSIDESRKQYGPRAKWTKMPTARGAGKYKREHADSDYSYERKRPRVAKRGRGGARGGSRSRERGGAAAERAYGPSGPRKGAVTRFKDPENTQFTPTGWCGFYHHLNDCKRGAECSMQHDPKWTKEELEAAKTNARR